MAKMEKAAGKWNGDGHGNGNGSPRLPSRAQQFSLFARNFFKHPRMLGALLPSSRFLVNMVLKRVDWEKARVFVEYGPGVGPFTAEILRRMRPDGILIALEMNGDFVRYLRKSFGDPRLHVIHGSAADVDQVLAGFGHQRADYVLSGIPFSTIENSIRESILRKTHAVLNPEGAFLVYQVSGAVGPYLEQVFGSVHRAFEPLNLLPARVFHCVR